MISSRIEVEALVFDSGLGGLSVAADMRPALQGLRFAYVADNAGLPYGDKSEEWLLDRVLRVIAAALLQVDPQIIVIACNTASTIVLPALRKLYTQPIVGVVPAIKPAAAQSQSQVIGLLATPATIKRSYTDSLIQDFAPHCQVIRVGSSELVAIAERKLRGESVDISQLRTICAPFLAHPLLDTLVLGCTHFPLLASELQAILPAVRILDSGAAVAQRARQLLPLSLPRPPAPDAELAFFTAQESPQQLEKILQTFGFNELRLLNIPG